MRRTLPPFPALRAFEAAARLGSFRAASGELGVTRSAVSHQIRKLEEHLGCQLYARGAFGPELNDRGRDYLRRVTPLLDELDACTAEVTGSRQPFRQPSNLALRAPPGIIARWLIPRLRRIRDDTGLTIKVSSGLPPTDFSDGEVDVILHWGQGKVKGVAVEPFLSTPRIVVASPAFLERFGRPRSPAELTGYCLLRDEVDDGWDNWLKGAGVAGAVTATGQALEHCEMVLGAVERGQGIALAYAALVEDDLRAGRMVRLFAHQSANRLIYSIAYPHDRRRDRRILAFRDWVMAEVGARNVADAVGQPG